MRTLSAGLPVICILAVVCLPASVSGADEHEAGSPREIIYAYKVWKLTDILDLSDEQMPVFFAKLKKIDDTEAEISEGERGAVKRIAELLDEKGVTDEDLAEALSGYEKRRAKRLDELQRSREEALAVLSVRQRCQYIVFEDGFRQEMRQMIGRARDLRRGEGAREARDERRTGTRSGQPGGSGRGRR